MENISRGFGKQGIKSSFNRKVKQDVWWNMCKCGMYTNKSLENSANSVKTKNINSWDEVQAEYGKAIDKKKL